MPSTNGHGSKTERVALYLRVSSEEQRERQSIETQREFLEQYRQLYGLEVVDIYEDDGVSGTTPLHERPDGRRLLEDARGGKFETLLVYRLDRIGRSLLVIVDAHDRLDSLDVALRSATEPIDTSTPSGRLIFQMLASFAEYERETIRERTRAGLHRAFRGGKHMGRIPYGYRATEDARLEVEAEEAEIVREVISNIAEGCTLYREARRLNDVGIPSPGWRYGTGERKPGRSWSATTISNLVNQPAYSGTHRVRINSGKESIDREVPALVTPNLQERAKAALSQNKRYRNRKTDRNYLLAGLVKCAVCGFACVGHPSTTGGKKYHFYACSEHSTERVRKDPPPHRRPYVNAKWLEETVWADVRGFLENPGEALERVREQLRSTDDTGDLAQRREDLAKRLASKQAEKDRYVRLYAQGHISESELELYLADLKNQIGNLRLLIESVETDLSQRHQHKELAETTHAWLITLKERISEVEEDTPEAFRVRRQLVKLLVEGITVGPRGEDGKTETRITYRFDPPEDARGEDVFVGTVQNNGAFVMPSGIDDGVSGGDVFQFASGPVQSELTGPAFTPDGKTLFLAIQHPGEESESPDNPTSTWPGGDEPKSSLVAITGFAYAVGGAPQPHDHCQGGATACAELVKELRRVGARRPLPGRVHWSWPRGGRVQRRHLRADLEEREGR